MGSGKIFFNYLKYPFTFRVSILDSHVLQFGTDGWRHFSAFQEVGITPRRSILGLFLLEETEERGAVHVRRHGDAGDLEERRRQVDVANEAVDDAAAADARTAHQKRHPRVEVERKGFA